jgi:predicted nucleic acid-binding protein
MLSAPFRVVLDACVVYPMHLRDVLLQAAAEGLYQVYWSQEILDEATRNLVSNLQIADSQAARLITAMSGAFPESLVTDYEHLVVAMRNDPKDRHVAAAAVKAGAQIIVTENIRDVSRIPGASRRRPLTHFYATCSTSARPHDVRIRKVCARRRRPPNEIQSLAHATLCKELASAGSAGRHLSGRDSGKLRFLRCCPIIVGAGGGRRGACRPGSRR